MLTRVECDFVDFVTQMRGVPRSSVEETFLKTRERFEFATRGYRDLCVTVHDLFSVMYGEANESELVASYRFHSLLHLFRFLAYSYEEPRLKADFEQRARTLVELVEGTPIVVDYGCGLGYISFAIGNLYPDSRIYLVDVDCTVLNFALYRFGKYHIDAIGIPVTESDVYPKLPSHNICIAEEVMEHLVRPTIAYRNIRESLERGGILNGNFSDHNREFFHVSPRLVELRESIARDFESVGNECYRKR